MRHRGVPVLTAGAADRWCCLADAGRLLLLLLLLGQGLGQSLGVGQTSEVHTEGLGEGSEGPRDPRSGHRTTYERETRLIPQWKDPRIKRGTTGEVWSFEINLGLYFPNESRSG